MSSITYGVVEELYSLGEESRTSYGIAAYADSEIDGTATIVLSVCDICSDKQRLAELVDRCNRQELSILHLHDAVEEFLCD